MRMVKTVNNFSAAFHGLILKRLTVLTDTVERGADFYKGLK
jgi:hypothetical protein